MKSQQILRLLLQEKVHRALRVNKTKLILECKKLGLSEATLYDFANYHRAYTYKKTILNIYLATNKILD